VALGAVGGKFAGALKFGSGFGGAAQLVQQVAADVVEQVVLVEGVGGHDLIDGMLLISSGRGLLASLCECVERQPSSFDIPHGKFLATVLSCRVRSGPSPHGAGAAHP
jgi:hypothetical protein